MEHSALSHELDASTYFNSRVQRASVLFNPIGNRFNWTSSNNPTGYNDGKTKLEGISQQVRSQATLLAQVAVTTSPGIRGWHPLGSPDAEGFLAIDCVEVLMHRWDCTTGTTGELITSESIADRIARRLFHGRIKTLRAGKRCSGQPGAANFPTTSHPDIHGHGTPHRWVSRTETLSGMIDGKVADETSSVSQ